MSIEPIRILLIEDSPGYTRLIREAFAEVKALSFELVNAETLAEGLARLQQGGLDAVLLDLSLPDSHGIGTLMKVRREAPAMPILVLTSLNDEVLAVTALQLGAQDYLVKGQVDSSLLARAVRYAIERKREQERLVQSEYLLTRAQQVAQLGSWQWDVAADVMSWSDELYRIYGLDPQSFKSTYEGFLAIVHADDREAVRQQIANALRDGQAFQFDHRIVRPDGAVQILNTRGEVFADPAGRPVKLIGTGQDITERKQIENELRESQALAQGLFEFAPDATAVVDRDGGIVRVNQQFERLFGYHRAELIGRSIETLVPERFRDQHIWHRTHYHAAPHSRTMGAGLELYALRSDGSEFSADIMLSPLSAADSVLIISIVRDITERKRNEEALRSSHEQLRSLAGHLQSAREEERRNIAREIHDQLGQGLSALKMDLAMLNRRAASNSDQEVHAAVSQELPPIMKVVDNIIVSVREIMTQLRPEFLEEVGLRAAMEWQVQEFQTRTGTHAEFSASPEQIDLDLDRSIAVFRILQESLTNVARHAGATQVAVRLNAGADRLTLEVEDDGQGFRHDGENKRHSFGILGMQERALLLGGKVEIGAVEPHGTRVRLQIPLPQALAWAESPA